MTDITARSPEEWRNYSTTFPISACRLSRGDLKRLYMIINGKQLEFRDRVLASLSKMQNESDSDFSSRRRTVSNAFVTSVTVTGANGEMFHGNNDDFFESPNIPDRLRSIFMSTITAPKALLNLPYNPVCNIVLFLDFSQPPLLDFSRLPSLPTPNESNFAIAADNESWFTSATTKLKQFFTDRETHSNWLHQAAIYDVLMMIIAVPIALWLDYRASSLLVKSQLPSLVSNGIYVYVFLISIILFRALFSYSRWVFPKVEVQADLSSSPLRHRIVWVAILMPIVAALLYDAIRSLIL